MKRFQISFLKWLTISLLCIYFGFMVGKFKQDILENSIQLLELDNRSLNAENSKLTQQFSLLQADYVTEKQVNEALVKENKELNETLDANNNKLYFYERVVAPGLSVTGLNIYSFQVTKEPGEERWHYELVLMQAQRGRRILSGKVDIMFSQADQTEETKELILSEIDTNFKGDFKFQYFQRLKGEFSIPDNVNVEQVFVIAEAEGDKWNRPQRIEKAYDWKYFIASEGENLNEIDTQAEGE